MSERYLKLYRVTEVADYLVEDDEIYEDDAEMLRDVLAAAKGGLLEFEPAEAEHVAMVWDEENRLVVRAIEELPEGAEEHPEGLYCPKCFRKQYLTPDGVDCQRGHGDLNGVSKDEAVARRGGYTAPAVPSTPTRTRALRPPRSPRQRNSR